MRQAASKTAKKTNKAAQASKEDIIKLILTDHEPLKRLVGILKDLGEPLRTRRRIFDQFALLFLVHARSEQESLYTFLKDENKELRIDGLEGEVEHELAEHMIEEVKMAEDPDLWSARAKVLAELVDHHLNEEEVDFLPAFKKECDIEDRVMLGKQYLELKDHFRREENLTIEEEEAIEEERNRDYRPSNLMQ